MQSRRGSGCELHTHTAPREQQTPTLNHPGIGAIYGLEESGDRQYLVLEFIEGETLADRLSRGPIPVDEALKIGGHIAEALEAAHEKGVIHRDLKPGNVMVTPDGIVKVLDFGLARTAETTTASASHGPSIANSPTITSRSPIHSPTIPGVIMGSAGYMSPEQARAKPLDKRTDIWSFGCVLFECLAGSMVFGGETATDAIAAILERDPDWSRLPARTPARVRDLLRHCLEKDARNRLRDIGDARIELGHALSKREWTTTGAMAAASGAYTPAGSWKRTLGKLCAWSCPLWLALAAVLGYQAWRSGSGAGIGGGLGVGANPKQAPSPVNRLSLELKLEPQDEYLSGMPSWDGRYFVYITGRTGDSSGRQNRLWVRPMDSYEPRLVEGSDGVRNGTISPDGRWVAFLRNSEIDPIRKAPIGGGPAVTICEHGPAGMQDIAWLDAGTLVVSSSFTEKSLLLLHAEGGDLRRIEMKGLPQDVLALFGISALVPGERTVVVYCGVESGEKGFQERLLSVDTDTGQVRTLQEKGAGGQLIDGDTFLFSRIDSLLAQKFDPVSRTPAGPVTPLMSGLRASAGASATAWWIRNGTLFYRSGGVQGKKQTLALFKSGGEPKPLGTLSAAITRGPSISPDGSKVALIIARENLLFGVGVYEIATDRLTMLPTGELDADSAITWTRDGRSLMVQAFTKGKLPTIYQLAVDGSSPPRPVFESTVANTYPSPSVLVDAAGEWLLTMVFDASSSKADWLLAPLAGGAVQTLAKGVDCAARPDAASPDGKWIVCSALDPAKRDLWFLKMPVPGQPYSPADRRRLPIEGTLVAWTPDGKSLLYNNGSSALMAVDVKMDQGEPKVTGTPRELVSLAKTPMVSWPAIMPGTQEVLGVPGSLSGVGSVQIQVVQNWLTELRAKLPADAGAPAVAPK